MNQVEIAKLINQAVKDILKATKKEFRHHVGVLKEHFDDKVKAIGEQYSSIKATQDEHTRILNQHTETLEKQRIILNSHSETLNEHTDILKANQETLLEHDTKLNEIDSTLKRIETKVDTNEQRVRVLETNH